MWKKALFIACILFFVTGCTYDEIEVDMRLQDSTPVFFFKYVKRVSKKTHIFDIDIIELDKDMSSTNNIVWSIQTYDQSVYDRIDGKLVSKDPTKVIPETYKYVELDRIIFGEVPDGFQQYIPSDNSTPVLQKNVRYLIRVLGGGPGHMSFTLDGKCRRYSMTRYSDKNPAFGKDFDCLSEGQKTVP